MIRKIIKCVTICGLLSISCTSPDDPVIAISNNPDGGETGDAGENEPSVLIPEVCELEDDGRYPLGRCNDALTTIFNGDIHFGNLLKNGVFPLDISSDARRGISSLRDETLMTRVAKQGWVEDLWDLLVLDEADPTVDLVNLRNGDGFLPAELIESCLWPRVELPFARRFPPVADDGSCPKLAEAPSSLPAYCAKRDEIGAAVYAAMSKILANDVLEATSAEAIQLFVSGSFRQHPQLRMWLLEDVGIDLETVIQGRIKEGPVKSERVCSRGFAIEKEVYALQQFPLWLLRVGFNQWEQDEGEPYPHDIFAGISGTPNMDTLTTYFDSFTPANPLDLVWDLQTVFRSAARDPFTGRVMQASDGSTIYIDDPGSRIAVNANLQFLWDGGDFEPPPGETIVGLTAHPNRFSIEGIEQVLFLREGLRRDLVKTECTPDSGRSGDACREWVDARIQKAEQLLGLTN